MKIALINDTHAGARGDSLLFNEFFFKFWEGTFFPYLKDNGITHIVHLGDVVDRRKFINYVILNQWRKRFFDVLEREGITMDVIVGNHDVTYKNTNEINAMHELFDRYDNINVFIDPVERTYDGLQIALMPWINSSNYENSLQFLQDTKSEIVFGHFEISGFEMDRGNVCHGGLDKKIFDRFDMVLSGHFHHKSSDGTIHYLGNQYEITWTDYNDPRGFHIFDTETRELEFISNPFKMFHKLHYDDLNQPVGYVNTWDLTDMAGAYVKVIVRNKTNTLWFDSLIDRLEKSGVSDVQVVEDHFHLDLESDDDIVSQAEDTLTILRKYVDQIDSTVNKPRLENLLRTLYSEALSVE